MAYTGSNVSERKSTKTKANYKIPYREFCSLTVNEQWICLITF